MQTNNYIKLSTASASKVVDLLVQAFEFEVIDGSHPNEEGNGILLSNPHGSALLVTNPVGETQPAQRVIINTSDCLKSCFQLSEYGIKIIDQPYYTDDGLAAEVSDQFGNHYILLEKRILIDN